MPGAGSSVGPWLFMDVGIGSDEQGADMRWRGLLEGDLDRLHQVSDDEAAFNVSAHQDLIEDGTYRRGGGCGPGPCGVGYG